MLGIDSYITDRGHNYSIFLVWHFENLYCFQYWLQLVAAAVFWGLLNKYCISLNALY